MRLTYGRPQLASFQFDVIASPDLVRAVETAAAIAAYHPPTYYGAVDPDLREMGFGDLEGQRIAVVKENGTMAATQDQWAAGDFGVRWPGIGGESPEQVATRGVRGLLVSPPCRGTTASRTSFLAVA